MDGNAPCASTNTMGFGKLFFLNSSSSCQCFSDLSIPASSERQSNAAPSVNTFIEGLLETFGEQYFSYIGKTLSCSPSISFDKQKCHQQWQLR